jgi:hypothetical protein
LWECAVGAFDGSTTLRVSENNEWSTILSRACDLGSSGAATRLAVPVEVHTLETLVREMRLSRIDLLKMDIEGAEVSVLHSLDAKILRLIRQVTVEFHSKDMFGFDMLRSVEDVIDLMKNRGFMCLDFSGRTRCDVLFINRHHFRIPRLQEWRWNLRTAPPAILHPIWTRLPAPAKRLMRPLLKRASGTQPKG